MEQDCREEWFSVLRFFHRKSLRSQQRSDAGEEACEGYGRVSTTVTRSGVPVIICSDVSRVQLASILQNYDDYRLLESDSSEAERAHANNGVDFEALFENDLL